MYYLKKLGGGNHSWSLYHIQNRQELVTSMLAVKFCKMSLTVELERSIFRLLCIIEINILKFYSQYFEFLEFNINTFFFKLCLLLILFLPKKCYYFLDYIDKQQIPKLPVFYLMDASRNYIYLLNICELKTHSVLNFNLLNLLKLIILICLVCYLITLYKNSFMTDKSNYINLDLFLRTLRIDTSIWPTKIILI